MVLVQDQELEQLRERVAELERENKRLMGLYGDAVTSAAGLRDILRRSGITVRL